MPIFRYTIKKMLLTPSTWIILLITIAFITLINTLLLVTFNKPNFTPQEIFNNYLGTWKDLMFLAFLGLMLFIFIAIKATQVFRDEIDDGTLLILVSKPVSRTRIWTEKLFALQTTILLFMFFSIFVSSIFIAIPGIGSGDIYSKMFPYMWILFAVGIIFGLIISSTAILLSLVMNAKAIVAIIIGFSALVNILSTDAIMGLVSPTKEYMQASQAAAVYNNAKSKLSLDDLTWLDSYIADSGSTIKDQITKDLKDIYEKYIPTISYPAAEYDYKLEQESVTKIANGTLLPETATKIDVALTKHILAVANVFRQWSQQSFNELLTGDHVGPWESSFGNKVDYSVKDMKEGLNLTINQTQYEESNKKLSQTKTLRYLNIFYHLKYIWNGISTPDGGSFVDSWKYKANADPYLFSWKKDPKADKYQVDTSKKANSKIISFTGDLTAYLVIGLILFGSSWFVFNRKDFA